MFYIIIFLIYFLFAMFLQQFQSFFAPIRKPPPRHGWRGGVGSMFFLNYPSEKNATGSVA
jgi:hypothetical protein